MRKTDSSSLVLIASEDAVVREGLRWILVQGRLRAQGWSPRGQPGIPGWFVEMGALVIDLRLFKKTAWGEALVDWATANRTPWFVYLHGETLPSWIQPERVLNGTFLPHEICQAVRASMVEGISAQAGSSLLTLTSRQWRVFTLLGSGLSNQQIAREMGVTVKTVETHKENLKKKLGMDSNGELRVSASAWVNQTEA